MPLGQFEFDLLSIYNGPWVALPDNVATGTGGNDDMRITSSIALVNGFTSNDRIRIEATLPLLNEINGGADDDQIYGGGGADIILGGEGDDYIEGGGGIDTLTGGDGEDALGYSLATGGVTVSLNSIGGGSVSGAGVGIAIDVILSGFENIVGSDHHDILTGNNLANKLFGLDGDDRLNGGDGNDTLVGGIGGDILNGDAGNDTLMGGSSGDTLYGGSGDDTLDGGDGVDNLNGGAGNDDIKGGSANDTIHGGGGNDRITGGAGLDTLYGDAGNDTFVFTSINDILPSLGDYILDYQLHADFSDIIDVSAIDANTTIGGEQPFSFIGSSNFSKSAGQLRATTSKIEGDVDGDGRADFKIFADTIYNHEARDFVL